RPRRLRSRRRGAPADPRRGGPPASFEVAVGDPRLAGVLIDVDTDNGRALTIRRLALRPEELPRLSDETPP
ncbi:MAG TPA: hypothetical protein PKD86_01165, partial [Gemmatales bacterium]|nr:hypothetical protein [Gemmatales bacterium]